MMRFAQLVFALLLALTAVAAGADAEPEDALEALSNQVKTINYRLDRGDFDQDDLARWTKVTIKLSGEASVCVADNETKIKKVL